VRFTLNLSMLAPELLGPAARMAEGAGFTAASVGDSVFYPAVSDSRYPYTASGDRTFVDGQPFVDPFVAAATVLAHTSSLTFQTSVIKLALRHPILVAKQAASVAAVSGDRLKLGVGMSPWPDDYEVLDVPLEGRGARFEEAVDIVRQLLAGGYVQHTGDAYRFPQIKIDPVPSRPLPLLIGGHGPRNLRRAARLADGWIAAATPLPELSALIATVLAERAAAGRSDEPFEIHASGVADPTAAGVRRLADIGVTDIVLRATTPEGPPRTIDQLRDSVRRLADLVADTGAGA
jgi:probable F420-dependent oxidoreductase